MWSIATIVLVSINVGALRLGHCD